MRFPLFNKKIKSAAGRNEQLAILKKLRAEKAARKKPLLSAEHHHILSEIASLLCAPANELASTFLAPSSQILAALAAPATQLVHILESVDNENN